jgi:hypothetical protein
MDRLRAEITVLLNLLVCRLPFYLHGASYGYQMQNLVCQRKDLEPFYAFFNVLCPYVQMKCPQWVILKCSSKKSIWGPKVESQLQRLELLWKTCSLLNLAVDGRSTESTKVFIKGLPFEVSTS